MPYFEKYFTNFENNACAPTQTGHISPPSRPTKGALRNVINAGRDAVDADGASDEGAG